MPVLHHFVLRGIISKLSITVLLAWLLQDQGPVLRRGVYGLCALAEGALRRHLRIILRLTVNWTLHLVERLLRLHRGRARLLLRLLVIVLLLGL